MTDPDYFQQSLEGRVRDNQTERLLEKRLAGFDSVPWRRAGWMGQGNQVERTARVIDGKRTADEFVELVEWNELGDGEFANRDDELRRKDFEFAAQPVGAIGDFE